MRFKLYLAVGGADFDAESFHKAVGLAGSTVKQIGHRGQEIDPTRFQKWNVWESARLDGSNDPGADIDGLIEHNLTAVTRLQNGSFNDCEVWVGIVCYHLEGEEPRGFSFASKTIQALAKIGASIEVDAVYDPAEIKKYQGTPR